MNNKVSKSQLEQATFAGGCFWCLQGPYDAEEAIADVEVGYAGSGNTAPTYYEVASGAKKFREAIHMKYDPSRISYNELLNIFWRQIDPTDSGGQFADRGYQYTTAIIYHTEEQNELAEQSKKVLQESGRFNAPIATVIIPFENFFPAEEEHQEYYKKNPLRYQLYKKGSGRADFIQKNWKKDK